MLVLCLAELHSCSLPAIPLCDFQPGHESFLVKISLFAAIALPRQVSSGQGEPKLLRSLPIGVLNDIFQTVCMDSGEAKGA